MSEENGTVSVCVNSGVTGGFETALTVSLTAEDGTACEFLLQTIGIHTLIFYYFLTCLLQFSAIPEDVFIATVPVSSGGL